MQREVVERAMAGDHDAFSELARVSIGRLYVIARLIVRDDGIAEDATQEALVSAWSHLGALRDPTASKPGFIGCWFGPAIAKRPATTGEEELKSRFRSWKRQLPTRPLTLSTRGSSI